VEAGKAAPTQLIGATLAGWVSETVWTFGEEKNLLPLRGSEVG
jgi:hypothetical protein